jgi:uncharacterized DUF497 family protein
MSLRFEWDEDKSASNTGAIRIISARRATKKERRDYEEAPPR